MTAASNRKPLPSPSEEHIVVKGGAGAGTTTRRTDNAAKRQELCASCMKPIEPGQEWCKTPQCDTDLRDSYNRIPASWVGKS